MALQEREVMDRQFARAMAPASLLALALGMVSPAPANAQDASISSSANGGTIVVTASGSRFAGAISSITYRSVQYIDIADHGREMQSALQLDGWGECYNPTEAGSVNDTNKMTSTSNLLSISSTNNVLQTQTQPAFWLAAFQQYGKPCNPYLPYPDNTVSQAKNTTDVSNLIFRRTTSFYGAAIPNLLNVDVSWSFLDNHASTNIEASTAYLPATFNVFLTYDRASRTLTKVPATATGSSTSLPVIIAQPNGLHSMGAFSPAIMTNPSNRYMAYFYFGTGPTPTAKWSCVFGESNISAGSTYSYSCPTAVGTVDEVIAAIQAYPVAGQTVTSMIPIFRFYKYPRHFLTQSYSEAANAGFSFETTAFHLFPAGGAGYSALYRCYNSSSADRFVSTQSNCEGFTNEGVFGFAATTQLPGTVPLYRFYRNSITDHLITVNYDEGAQNAYTYEGILGYVAY